MKSYKLAETLVRVTDNGAHVRYEIFIDRNARWDEVAIIYVYEMVDKTWVHTESRVVTKEPPRSGFQKEVKMNMEGPIGISPEEVAQRLARGLPQ